MGRGGRRNKKKRQNPKWGQSAEGAVEDEAKVKDDGWDSNPFDKENEAFVKYYRVCPLPGAGHLLRLMDSTSFTSCSLVVCRTW